jgi:DNA mismatch repair ATPase MutS
MKTKYSDAKCKEFTYLYKMEKGISNVRGGIKVLSDMNYPKEILDKTKIYEENNKK